jgi:hypothetical protein
VFPTDGLTPPFVAAYFRKIRKNSSQPEEAATRGNPMDLVEQAVILQSLRDVHKNIGFDEYEDLADKLVELNSTIDRKAALNCCYGRPVREAVEAKIATVGLNILASNYKKVLKFYDVQNKSTRNYIIDILSKYRRDMIPDMYTNRSVNIIFGNWVNPSRAGNFSLRTGIYQVFRRYKPTRNQRAEISPILRDMSDDMNHPVICELVYFDIENMNCTFITGDLNVYVGSIYLSYEDIIYGIMQRPSRDGTGVHQRIMACKLERTELKLYSGLCIKTGDTTDRPLASELLFLRVPASHTRLYDAMKDIRTNPWRVDPLDRDSVVARYIAITPPKDDDTNPDWKRVRYIGDFPWLARMAKLDSHKMILFREPSRTVSKEELAKVTGEFRVTVFTQSNYEQDVKGEE